MTIQDDERCCGTGTCLINDEGRCWCGQKWDGAVMCFEPPQPQNSGQLVPALPAESTSAHPTANGKSQI